MDRECGVESRKHPLANIFVQFHNTSLLDIEKDVFILLQARNIEKILSPYEESNLRPSDSAL